MSADATVRVNADTSKAVAAIDRLNKSLTAVKLDSMINLAQRAGAAGQSVVSLAARFENLQVRLKTIEGSTGAAASAFGKLEQFATKVPLSVDEVVNSFIKLKTLGLDPSEAALMSYTNTASAMGKSLDQLVEAVADAAMGEFERLKEFGIKAKKQGDEIEFTFNGVTTTVKNSSEDIQAYLRKIGEVNFAGAANDQMKTLTGTISNLSVAWDKMANTIITASGASEWFKEILNDLTELFDVITNKVNGVSYPLKDVEKSIADVTEEIAAMVAAGSDNVDMLDELDTRLSYLVKRRDELRNQAGPGGDLVTQNGQTSVIMPEQQPYAHVDLVKQEQEAQAAAQAELLSAQVAFREMMLGTDLAYWYGATDAAAMSYADQLTALEDFHRAKLLSDEQYAAAKKNIEGQVKQNTIDSLKDLGNAFGGQSKEMFAAMQAYNIATAIMNTYTAATEALKLPFPLNWIQMGGVIAAGMAQVATIKAQKYQGRMYGGTITGNQPYLVGERGPEIVTPGRTGTVTPNDEIGSKVVNITFDISATNAEGFDELLQQRKPLIVGMIRQAVSEQPELLGA